MSGWARARHRVVWGSSEVENEVSVTGPCAKRTAWGQWLGGTETKLTVRSESLWWQMGVSPTGSLEGAGAKYGPSQDVWGPQMGWSPAKYLYQRDVLWTSGWKVWNTSAEPFQNLQLDPFWQAYLEGLEDHIREGLKLIHGPLQGPQLGTRSVCLLLEARVGGACDRTKIKCSLILRGRLLLPSQ